MAEADPNARFIQYRQNGNRCLSCGCSENMGRRRYCSVECRQRLRYKLQVRTGLLRALNTRYATFHFDDRMIVLDVLPYGSKEIFSFLFPRSNGNSPADDFNAMADILGNYWWAEKRKTRRNYLASRSLLKRARTDKAPTALMPVERIRPSVSSRALLHLKLGRKDLNSPDLDDIVRRAFRRQAKRHHPDLGGSAALFRRLHEAYTELLSWAENPSFFRRQGFPDKWFYSGERNRWVQPIPHAAREQVGGRDR
ncbi:MAG: J domain-containing protein [Desulfobacterales bacterium]